MTKHDSHPGFLPPEAKKEVKEIKKDDISKQLDVFTEKHGLKSLQDRLRIGLNEVAMLAYDKTNTLIEKMTERMTETPEEAEKLYQNVLQMCIEVQTRGPWAYTDDLKDPSTPQAQAWFMLIGSESIGYDREMDLNGSEFQADVERIMEHLGEAIEDPASFFEKSRSHLVEDAKKTIRFEKNDKDKRAPIGEGFSAFVPMAIQGYEAGVVQDAEGWIFVGARGEIEDDLIESTGLEKEVAPDDRDPSRTVTFYKNQDGQRVLKKIHPGLLVALSKKFDIATSIASALNDEREVIDIANDALGHVRVLQTSEKKRDDDIEQQRDHENRKAFLNRPEFTTIDAPPSDSTALSRPREDFYTNLQYIRSKYTFLDALRNLKAAREKKGKVPTEREVEKIAKFQSEKMHQKAEEVRHINQLVDGELDLLPDNLRKVIDMAGGAGDLGLGVANELLSLGRELDGVEIVDPQEGVDDFMRTIIGYLPFREKLEKIATHALDHGTGYLQDTKITPDSLVVAKHACGVLTDAVIDQWRDSESPMLIAMTCCQGKAKNEPARYGFSQSEWSRLCSESDMTNTELYGKTGKELEMAEEKHRRGMKAMKTLDMARVEYLRRHGFSAKLDITDKFPKGDTIIARRLPGNFMDKLFEIEQLESSNPLAFDALMMKTDILAAGKTYKGEDSTLFGADWIADDYAEIGRRFISTTSERYIPEEPEAKVVADPEEARQRKEAKKKQKQLFKDVLPEHKGQLHLYIRQRYEDAGVKLEKKDIGMWSGSIKSRILRNENEPPADIRKAIDEMISSVLEG